MLNEGSKVHTQQMRKKNQQTQPAAGILATAKWTKAADSTKKKDGRKHGKNVSMESAGRLWIPK